MDELMAEDSEFEPAKENYQDFLSTTERPCKASDDDDDDDEDEEEEEEENSSYRPADSSAQTSGIAPCEEAEAATVAMTTLATELTDEEIRDVQEMGVKLQEFEIDSAEDDELQTKRDEDSSAKLLAELEKRPNVSETDVDDIMNDSFTLAGVVDCSENDRGDVKESKRHSETGLPMDDDDDDEDDMKELLRFKRQNSRDYLEQAPIDGLLEGIAEEPEEEGTKDIEEEYDSVVIKDEDEESGSASDAANDNGKEEIETIDIPSPSVVDVVTSVEAVTATVVDIDGEDDTEVREVKIETAEPSDQEPHGPQNGGLSEINIVERTTEAASQKQEAKEGEKLTASTEPAVELMDTTTSPSSSGTTSDENIVTFDVAKDSDKTSTDELTFTTGQSKNRNHDYVNIGDLDGTSNDLDAETVRRAAKAEISDEDFCFDEASTKSSSEQPDASCDYVNVDTIRANKRLVSRMIQEGNDEEFERLEAEIISKLEDEEDSDYCVPKSTPVVFKSGDTELKHFADINGSAATDENENLSLSGHQDLLAADAALAEETSDPSEVLKSLDITRNEEFQGTDQHLEISEIEKWTCEKTPKVNGSSEPAGDSDDEIITDYKYPRPQKVISSHEQEKILKEEIESCRDDPSLKDSFGLQQVKKSSDHSRLASPAYETSSGVRTSDILPEAGSVKALVAQWQQMESKRWSRKDDMKVQNGGDQAECRGMNRSRSCGPLPRKIRVLSPDGVLDDEGRRINDWTIVVGGGEGGDSQEQYNSQPSLTRAMLVKFERLDYETSASAKQAPPPTKKTFKWEVKETKTLNRPGFLAH